MYPVRRGPRAPRRPAARAAPYGRSWVAPGGDVHQAEGRCRRARALLVPASSASRAASVAQRRASWKPALGQPARRVPRGQQRAGRRGSGSVSPSSRCIARVMQCRDWGTLPDPLVRSGPACTTGSRRATGSSRRAGAPAGTRRQRRSAARRGHGRHRAARARADLGPGIRRPAGPPRRRARRSRWPRRWRTSRAPARRRAPSSARPCRSVPAWKKCRDSSSHCDSGRRGGGLDGLRRPARAAACAGGRAAPRRRRRASVRAGTAADRRSLHEEPRSRCSRTALSSAGSSSGHPRAWSSQQGAQGCPRRPPCRARRRSAARCGPTGPAGRSGW